MKLLVIQCAGLGYELWEKLNRAEYWKKMRTSHIQTVFPAVTCPVQASFRTASPPSSHGMIANGLFDRKLKKAMFWEQSSSLYSGERIWSEFRRNGGSVGQICWQQSLGNDSDLILSPAPIHKHHGGMIQDFFSVPSELYRQLCSTTGKKFNLHSYWGPFTSCSSTEWITNAAIELLKSQQAADLQLVYLPHLDYSLQKFGPDSEKTVNAFKYLESNLSKLMKAARHADYEIIVFGDYAIEKAEQALFPNKILREAGLFLTREVKGMLYPDLYTSKAFAMVDHQVAHIYVYNKEDIKTTVNAFNNRRGIRNIFTKGMGNYIENQASGEIILEAEPGYWFAYPWWTQSKEQPDYATHIDIHNKPGFDPCELFLSLWPPMSISTDTSKVKGTHGLNDKPVLLATSMEFDKVNSIIDAAALTTCFLKT